MNVINKAFKEGWGAVIAKTVSLEAEKVVNVTPRYAKLYAGDGKEVIGWENIELISDRKFSIWIEEFKKIKDAHPEGILIASIMEEFSKDAWVEIVERCQDAGVDAFECNFSCPHGLPERKMGAAMGQVPEILEEVCGWVMGAAKKPVWAKMTPNVTRITDPSRASLRAGCNGLARDQYDPQRDGREPRDAAAGADGGGIHHARRVFVESGAADRAADGDGNRDHDSLGISGTLALGHRRRGNGRRCGAVHPARRGHGAGLHRRDEVRLRTW